MPVPRPVLNAFTVQEVNQITGLSKPMIDYLYRMNFLRPSYGQQNRGRGRVRYYSYRDLTAARLVQRLRETGVELHKLKQAVQLLRTKATWAEASDPAQQLSWLVSDGREVLLKSEDGFLETFRPDGQRVFTFVVNLPQLQSEVKALVPAAKRDHFSMETKPLAFAK